MHRTSSESQQLNDEGQSPSEPQLVGNAGICLSMEFVEHTGEEFDRQVAVNLKGTHVFTRQVVSGLVERGDGAIIHVGSVAAFNFAAWTRDAAFELASKSVRLD